MGRVIRSFTERQAEDATREALETITLSERLLAHILIELMETRAHRKQSEIARRLQQIGFSKKQAAALLDTTPASLAVTEGRGTLPSLIVLWLALSVSACGGGYVPPPVIVVPPPPVVVVDQPPLDPPLPLPPIQVPPPAVVGRYKWDGQGRCYLDATDSGPHQCALGQVQAPPVLVPVPPPPVVVAVPPPAPPVVIPEPPQVQPPPIVPVPPVEPPQPTPPVIVPPVVVPPVVVVPPPVVVPPVVPPVPAPAGLLQKDSLVYQGAFRVPAGPFAPPSTFDYGGAALAFNPAKNSLFLVGQGKWPEETTEISIPAVQIAPLTQLARATMLQPFTDIMEGRRYNVLPGNLDGIYTGGLLPYRGKLYATAYVYYDGSGAQATSHFVSGLDFTVQGDVVGPVALNTRAGFVSGYMGLIPEAWRARLGGPALTGNCCLSIIGRTSSGPAVFAFDPEDVGNRIQVPVTPLVYYPLDHPLSAYRSVSPLFNGSTLITGVVFPEGTRSVLFFGRHGVEFCYGPGTADLSKVGKPATDIGDTADPWCYDPTSTDKGGHAYPYQYQVWAYDANDLARVASGTHALEPWEVRPYAIWTLDLPPSPWGRTFLKGAAYDPATQRIFISQAFGDGAAPLIHVFTVRP